MCNVKTKKRMKYKQNLKYLGIYQIIGGILGLIISLLSIGVLNRLNGGHLLIYLIILSLYSFSFYCGYLLYRGEYSKGINLSIYNNFIQIIGFGIVNYSFKYVSGIFAGVYLDLTHDTKFGLDLGISTWELSLNSNSGSLLVNFNFIALLILNYLVNVKEKLEKQIIDLT